ncbi:MAG TPA: FAD-linked oxidase C-terminal domain-containing protein [Verrucomicrobiae bacterium]|nr:FAD-linked oxidase C-terminal domain-containing protein [Verrucomicrobiae bacterium]
MSLSADTLRRLTEIVGPANFQHSAEERIAYSYDATPMLARLPEAIVFVESAPQISDVLKLANGEGFKVVPRGSGTNLSGGTIPMENCVVLVTVKMDKILEIDPRNLTALVEPGVLTARIDEAAGAHGLFYPPDPGSIKISTIGGNVAENSGGLRGLKYGVTRDCVLGLEVVLPSGELLRCGTKCVKDVAGYSLKDLFIGSEGTLGIVTQILLKLLPRPAARRTMLATFAAMADAAETVSDIIAHKIIPCTLEFLDKTTIACVEDYAKIGLPLDAEAILLMETDGHPVVVEEESTQMIELARAHRARDVRIAKDAAEAEKLTSARRAAFSALAGVSPTTILEDATVPRSELATMIAFIQQTAAKYQLRIGIFGHFGDGNLHPTFLCDERNPEEIKRVHTAFREIFEKTVALGGTITGEHGVGLAKKEFLEQFAGQAGMNVMRALKHTLDPNHVLNPGKIFD